MSRGSAASGEPHVDPLLVVVGLLGGLVLVAGGWLWATVMVAGRLFGGRWPALSVATVGGALSSLVRDPAHPAAALPPRVTALLPETSVFYGVGVGLVFVPCVLLMLAGVTWRAWRERDVDDGLPEPSARWADLDDLAPLIVRRPTPGRLSLGRVHGRLIAAEPLQSVCLFGPTRSGKTTSFAVPAVLEWDGPAIVCSVKADLTAATIAHRRSEGEVKVFDPLGLTPWEAASWSPLGRIRTWGDARRVAYDLANVAQTARGLTDSNFWLESAADLMAPLLYAAALGRLAMTDVVGWVQAPTRSSGPVLDLLGELNGWEAIAALQAVLEDEPKTRANIFTTTRQFLSAFADPRVGAATSGCEITPVWLHAGANTLYLCAPSHDQDRLRPLFVSLLQEQIRAVYEWQQSAEGGLDRPLLVMLDEAANIAAMPDLDLLASTCAGHGIQLMTVFQDLAQVRARWGDRAQTVVNNHRGTVLLPGLKDEATLKYAAELLGEEELVRTSTTSSDEKVSTTESTDHRRIATPDALRRLTPGTSVLVYGSLPPARMELTAHPGTPSTSGGHESPL